MNNTNSQEATYAAYVENLQSIEYSIKDTFNIAKNKISKKQQTRFFYRVFSKRKRRYNN